jgi:hypothetical protein
VHEVQARWAVAGAAERDRCAVGRPGWSIVVGRAADERLLLSAVCVDDEDVAVAAVAAGEGDLVAVGRPRRPSVVDRISALEPLAPRALPVMSRWIRRAGRSSPRTSGHQSLAASSPEPEPALCNSLLKRQHPRRGEPARPRNCGKQPGDSSDQSRFARYHRHQTRRDAETSEGLAASWGHATKARGACATTAETANGAGALCALAASDPSASPLNPNPRAISATAC